MKSYSCLLSLFLNIWLWISFQVCRNQLKYVYKPCAKIRNRKDWFKEPKMDTWTLQSAPCCHFLILCLPLGGSYFSDFERKTRTKLGQKSRTSWWDVKSSKTPKGGDLWLFALHVMNVEVVLETFIVFNILASWIGWGDIFRESQRPQ